MKPITEKSLSSPNMSSLSDRLSSGAAYYLALLAAIMLPIIFMFNRTNPILLNTSIVLLPAFGIVSLAVSVSCVMQTGVSRDDRVSVVCGEPDY